jgi:hypothetical protein
VHGVAGWLESREPGDLVAEVRSYARRNPGTFLVGAALLGVVAGRLTRNVAAVSSDRSSGTTAGSDYRPAYTQPVTDPDSTVVLPPTQPSGYADSLPSSGYAETTQPTGYAETAQPTGYPETTQSGYADTTQPTGYPETTQSSGYPETTPSTGYSRSDEPGEPGAHGEPGVYGERRPAADENDTLPGIQSPGARP